MSLTLKEIKERVLHRLNAEDLLEILDISSEELMDRFEDKLINNFEKLEEQLDDF